MMVAKGGDRLLREDAVEALRGKLLPLATVITPNLPEAEVLSGLTIRSLEDAREAAKHILNAGAATVVIKGGHLSGDESVDIFYDGTEFHELRAERIDTKNTHGTGCTFASAIAAGLAKGQPLLEAVTKAKEYVTNAIRANLSIGGGHGPLDHFYEETSLKPPPFRHARDDGHPGGAGAVGSRLHGSDVLSERPLRHCEPRYNRGVAIWWWGGTYSRSP